LKVRFIYPSGEELDETIKYYDHQLPGLGLKFYMEVKNSIDRIIDFPEAWTQIGKYTRRCLIKSFPYSILYTVDDEILLILAIAHMHRNPEYYKNRVSSKPE